MLLRDVTVKFKTIFIQNVWLYKYRYTCVDIHLSWSRWKLFDTKMLSPLSYKMIECLFDTIT
jgi:hypothetical protein